MEKENPEIKNDTEKVEKKEDNKEKEHDEDIEVKGYGYWKREGDLIDRDKFIPKPIESTKVNAELTMENKNSTGGSAWNTAGTWEEKHYKKNQIENFFNEKLPGLSVNEKLKFKSIKNYSGDVSSLI